MRIVEQRDHFGDHRMERFITGSGGGASPEVIPHGFPIDTAERGIVIPLLDGLPDLVEDAHPLPLVETCIRFRDGRLENQGGKKQQGHHEQAQRLFRSCHRRHISAALECADRDVVPVRISNRELLRSSVRIDMWLLLEPRHEPAGPL
jgi:hypothetical protein